jgi:EAL domain-containing protein (putative c-di-GMP-specific phosphodiesterase class I)/PleD family two-component response regulator
MNDTANTTTLLIADDDPSHLLLVEAALAGAGFLVHTANDGEEAVQRFGEVRPDVVILDVMMPKLTGIEACRLIRQQTGQRIVPILMLTGRNDLPAISDAFAAGASDFAQKGMNPRLLVERVRFLLRDRALQEELRASRSKLLLAQSIARVGHWELRVDGQTLHVSPMLGELLGQEAASLARYEDFVALLDTAERDAARQAFVTCATGNGSFGFDHLIRTAAGKVICLHQEAELIHGAGGPDDRVVIVTLQDLTRLHRAEESVRRLSYFDADTKLPNRRHLAEQVTQFLAEPAGIGAAGIVAFRLHNFDRVVQAHGKEYAGRLLVQVSQRIAGELARVGEGGSILWRNDQPSVCRTAEGELALLLRSRISAEHMATVTHALLETITTQAAQDEAAYVPAISAGLALAEGEAGDADQLVANAHAAAELATTPRSCTFFSPMPQAQMRRRLLIESSLRSAVERRELQLVYQPRVAIDTFELAGVECLVRWDHPQYGTIRPEEFISIAEETGVIEDIGRWMFEEACRTLAVWRERYDRKFFASTSVTTRQLRDPRLVTAIEGAIARYHLPADALQVELSEAAIIDSPELANAVLKALRERGVRVGLDDFGTGHSSLGAIRKVPLNSMKLDRSLIADLYTDPWAQGVAAAVLAMARAMQIRSVVDGADDPAALEMLRALGCDEVQGLHVAPPMKARDFEEWLERGGARHLARGFDEQVDRELGLLDGPIDDVMKWANG